MTSLIEFSNDDTLFNSMLNDSNLKNKKYKNSPTLKQDNKENESVLLIPKLEIDRSPLINTPHEMTQVPATKPKKVIRSRRSNLANENSCSDAKKIDLMNDTISTPTDKKNKGKDKSPVPKIRLSVQGENNKSRKSEIPKNRKSTKRDQKLENNITLAKENTRELGTDLNLRKGKENSKSNLVGSKRLSRPPLKALNGTNKKSHSSVSPLQENKNEKNEELLNQSSSRKSGADQFRHGTMSKVKMLEDTEKLESIFPSVNPVFLKTQYTKMKGSLMNTIDLIILKEKIGKLPTREDYERTLETEKILQTFLSKFSVEDFLLKIPDPWSFFLTSQDHDSIRYGEHSLHYLKNKFKKHYVQNIQDVLTRCDYSLYRAHKELMDKKKSRMLKMRATNRSKAECDAGKPHHVDYQFLQEVSHFSSQLLNSQQPTDTRTHF